MPYEKAPSSGAFLPLSLMHILSGAPMHDLSGVDISTIAGKSEIEIGVRPGSELSFYASAQGKIMTAYGTEQFRERTLRGELIAFTKKTVSDPASLAEELNRIKDQGYASAPEQVLLGINSIAVPIFDKARNCVASVAIVGSIQHIHQTYEKIAVGSLKKCADKVSQKLGFILQTDTKRAR